MESVIIYIASLTNKDEKYMNSTLVRLTAIATLHLIFILACKDILYKCIWTR